ncbi:hypothetical protein AXX17_AT1G51280 [Arabidopsis thaliana]|uniref:Uncharacterized protein n=1 Tax=Arabidopsis thaliana TaxID=3702 RepID=A0A178W3W9_ARATH|nr:hypothetical protein AXX17_AT1G51280 [Arabidopsis thaliana]
MEEKTRKIQRRTQSSSTMSSHDNDISQSEHIPLDLTIEILSRLPAFAPSLSSGRPSPPIKILSTRWRIDPWHHDLLYC